MTKSDTTLSIQIIGNATDPHTRGRATAVARHGANVTILSQEKYGCNEIKEKVITAPLLPGPFRRLQTFRFALQWIRELQQADVTHIHYAREFGAWMSLIAGTTPVVVSTMGGDVLKKERWHEMNPFEAALTKRVLTSADLVTAKSDFLAKAAMDLGVRSECIYKTVWGVDTSVFHPTSTPMGTVCERFGLPEQGPFLLYPRSIAPLYNTHVAVEALALIRNDFPDTKLLLAGGHPNPEYLAKVRETIRKHSLEESVFILGGLDQKAMPDLYNLADVTLSLAGTDGLPQALLESMACGTPCILTRLDRFSDFVSDKVNALLAAPTPEDVKRAASQLLGDKALRTTIIKSGLATIANRGDLHNESGKLLPIYEKLAANRHPKPFATRIFAGILFGLNVFYPLFVRLKKKIQEKTN
ncbi:glycosyltransferase family 4 protein [uncultured Pseudodesulfovibrio sp.]|uniref:glycosyltransferase family 4 protein n=1 Tax=uncultured Pseudodesulfovibrio sp. TaxID=2035858 RepID=UPI0029C644C5|nr:glycosyltransferase family 4 protein [uncultured Pseudodesulfovibrio sp.]